MASLYGWGCLVNRWSYGALPSGWAYPSALGIAFLIAVGGVLNLVYLARPPVLLALLAVGLGLAIFFVYRTWRDHQKGYQATNEHRPKTGWKTTGNLIYLAFILVVFSFLVQALLPSRSFNFHDDYHIYLLWPVRMLQTGSLGGNPFDQLGFIGLGAQSFLQGMFLTLSSVDDINAFDAILCLILTLGLLKEIGERLGVRMVFTLAACGLALLINPQYVNVSSLYSGALMLLGLTYGTLLLTESLASPDSPGVIRATVPCSLFFAALLSLKTTYVFVGPLFWVASLAGTLVLLKDKKRTFWAHVSSAVISVALLLPWLLLNLDRYIRKIRYLIEGIRYPSFSNFGGGSTLIKKNLVLSQLISNEELFWGNNYRDFLIIDVMLLLALAIAGWFVWRRRDERKTIVRLLPFLVLGVSVIVNYFCYCNLVSFRADQVIRYSCPLLIGAAPLAVLLAGWLWEQGLMHRPGMPGNYKTPLVLGGLLVIFQLANVGMFQGTFVERVKRAENYGSLISFPLVYNRHYIDYNAYALSDEAHRWLSFVQGMVPAGESIFAWVSMPMYLDFNRNEIFTTSEYGISNPFLVMPLTEGVEGMQRFFRQRGIRYFIWEYKGYGMKPEEQLGGVQRKFIEVLVNFLPESRVLYNDGSVIAFDIGSGN